MQKLPEKPPSTSDAEILAEEVNDAVPKEKRAVKSSEGVPNSCLLYSRLRLQACGRSFCESRRCNLVKISACDLGS